MSFSAVVYHVVRVAWYNIPTLAYVYVRLLPILLFVQKGEQLAVVFGLHLTCLFG